MSETIPPTNPNHSTGPKSPWGKQTSSRNAVKHGSCSTATLILPNESMDDFKTLEKTWFQGFNVDYNNPRNPYEADLIRTAARADWFFQRADRNYCEVEAQYSTNNPDAFTWDDHIHQQIARFLRYRTSHANSVAKHRKAIEDYRRNRAQEVTREQALRHKEEKLVIYKEKNGPEPTWQEEIDNLRKQSIAMGFLTPDGKLTGKK